jgi:hypothetical protein
MPTALMEKYAHSQQDPDVLAIRDDIALQHALLMQALEQMERGEAGELWVKLKEAWQDYQSAKKDPKGDPGEALAMVGFLITEGFSEYMSRIEIRQMLQEGARLKEAEVRRLERAHGTMTMLQALTLARGLQDAVRAHVSDPAVLARIQREFIRLLGSADSIRTNGRPGEQSVLVAGPGDGEAVA